jgi:hypothetical protein
MNNLLLRAITTFLTAVSFLVGFTPRSGFAEQPGYYRVQGIVAGDQLNMRIEPMGKVNGSFANGALVVSNGETRMQEQTKWLNVNSGEAKGWAAARYLKLAEVLPLMGSRLPVRGTCGGFEPGWNITWNNELAKISFLDGKMSVKITSAQPAKGHIAPNMITAKADDTTVRLIVDNRVCYALPLDSFVWGTAQMILIRGSSTTLYNGCCRPINGGYK